MKQLSNESMMSEELAAALVESLKICIEENAEYLVQIAVAELGADDGMEVNLTEGLNNEHYAGGLVAEALLARPEVYEALNKVGGMLIARLKSGESSIH